MTKTRRPLHPIARGVQLVATLALAASLVTRADAATVVDLGSFVPIGINASGAIAGDIPTPDPNPDDFDDPPAHAGIWANGVLTPLPESPAVVPLPATFLSDALAISDGGRVVGLEYVNSDYVFAVYWDGVAAPTRMAPLSSGFDFSQALDIDAAGNMVGVRTLSAGNHPNLGFYQSPGGPQVEVGRGNLPSTEGSTRVGAISGDGTKMLGDVTGAGAADGHYIWSTATPAAAGVKLDIEPARNPYAAFGASVYAVPHIQNSMARDGAVVGYRDSGGTRSWFLRTPDGTVTPITGLSAVTAVNDDHVVVGTIATQNPISIRAAKWDPVTKTVTDLNTLLPENSGWFLGAALAIADSGEIAGVGVHDGVEKGFLLKAVSLTAQVAVAPPQVRVDPEARIRIDVTLTNKTAQTLNGVAAVGPPTVAGTGVVELVEGPFPASLNLGPNESGTITYGFRPTQKGTVTFTFPGFADASGTVQNDEGAVSTTEVKIVDVGVEVSVMPESLASEQLAVVRIKVTDSKGQPIVGQRVRLRVPRWVGSQRDQTPAILVCDPQGRVYPPGESEILDIVRTANTDSSGQLVYSLRLGSDRTVPASTQLLVLAEALDETGALQADGSFFVGIADPNQGGGPATTLNQTLDTIQKAQLPASKRDDFGGITGYGTPLDVLRKTVLWLAAERQLRSSPLRNVDFAPITSSDGKNVGVVFFGLGQGRDVRAYLDGTRSQPPAGAAVLLIEIAQVRSVHSGYWANNLVSLSTWESSRPFNRGGSEDLTSPPRGRAVAATTVVTDDPQAFFGYPYPSLSPATGPEAGGCRPAVSGVSVALHSPVSLFVKDAAGSGAGFDADGNYANEAGGVAYAAGEPSLYLAPPGSFTADVNGTDSGRATIVMTAVNGGGVTAKIIALRAKKGKSGTLTFDDTLASPRGTFGKKKLKAKTGVPLDVAGLKRRVKVNPGDELRFTVTDMFGLPVQGARVHATGKDFDANTVTGADGAVALPLLVTKPVKLTLEISGPGLQTKKQKVAVKVRKP